jgi:lipopolysaccharide biosynthesis regulator YciM
MSLTALFLVCIALGCAWYAGYRARAQSFISQQSYLPRDYLVGLNFLLNEEPDKAVDVFIKMLEVDSNTVETHFALAKLFRRRGEVDRAIRIHQNLIARPQLDKLYRELSLLELGQDYLSAGVLDRAERIFLEVVDIKEHAAAALRALLDIYQLEKSWEKAISTATKLGTILRQNMHAVIAQYYCELAEVAQSKGQLTEVVHYLKKALETDAACVRASMLQAQVDIQQEDYKAALRHLKNIKNQNADYLSEVIHLLALCYEKLNEEDKMVVYLMKVLEEYPKIPIVLILSERIRQWKGDKVAAKFVADYIRRYPSLSGLHLFINLYISSAVGRARDDLLILHGLTHKLLADKPEYQCVSCGFSGKSLHWQCPGCKQWSSVKPLHSLEQ